VIVGLAGGFIILLTRRVIDGVVGEVISIGVDMLTELVMVDTAIALEVFVTVSCVGDVRAGVWTGTVIGSDLTIVTRVGGVVVVLIDFLADTIICFVAGIGIDVSAKKSINTTTTPPTRVTIVRSLPITVPVHTPARTSPTHDTVTKTSKAIAVSTITNSVNMSTPILITSPTTPSITRLVKRIMNPPARPTITKSIYASIRNALTDIVTTTPSSPASTGTLITGRELNKSLKIVDCICALLIIVF
jgi:hypothetical protein